MIDIMMVQGESSYLRLQIEGPANWLVIDFKKVLVTLLGKRERFRSDKLQRQ